MAEKLPLKLVDIGSGLGELREFAATDTLSWSKVSSTPTTLAGYGITDGATLPGLTASVTELNYTDGVTSAIQTQFTGKLSLTGGTMTGALTLQAGSVLEAGRYIDFHYDSALDHDVRLETSDAATTGAGILTLTASGGFVCTGNITAYSDIRLKENIELIPDALAKACSLRGVTFDRVDTGLRQCGLIAQEVQKVLPEAVMVGADENETLAVAYGNIVGLLVEAIKELKAEIDELKGGQ